MEKGPIPVASQTTYLVFYLLNREENGKGPQEKGRQGKPTRTSKMVLFLQTVVWKAPQQTAEGGGEPALPLQAEVSLPPTSGPGGTVGKVGPSVEFQV